MNIAATVGKVTTGAYDSAADFGRLTSTVFAYVGIALMAFLAASGIYCIVGVRQIDPKTGRRTFPMVGAIVLSTAMIGAMFAGANLYLTRHSKAYAAVTGTGTGVRVLRAWI